MKKLTLGILALAAFGAIAGVVDPFVQFTGAPTADGISGSNGSDICYYYGQINRPDQPWVPQQLIKVHVAADSSVYLSNFVDSWYHEGGVVPALGTVYNMNPSNYGYYDAADLTSLDLEKSEYAEYFKPADGSTTEITYFDDENPTLKAKTTGYLLAHFDEEKDIYLAMTPLDKSELMDSYQYVQEEGHEATDLQSRQHNTTDFAGNIRINFGIDVDSVTTGREFVAVYTITDDDGGIDTTGQPLPGLLLAGLLSLGTVATGRKLRKRA